MNPTAIALILAVPLILLGAASAAVQLRGRRDLAKRTHVPSDEGNYLRGRYRRRLLMSVIMVLAGVMIAGAYLSGLEAKADSLQAQTGADGQKQGMTDDDRQFVRLWGFYWIGVILLTFALVGIAIADAIASRRYWLGIYREMKEEHQAKLRRDLAVYKQHKDDRGAMRGQL